MLKYVWRRWSCVWRVVQRCIVLLSLLLLGLRPTPMARGEARGGISLPKAHGGRLRFLLLNPEQPGSVHACSATLSPASDYAATQETLRGTPGAWTNVCLQPGAYAGPVKLQHAQFIQIIAPLGGVTISASINPLEPVRERRLDVEHCKLAQRYRSGSDNREQVRV